MTINHIVSVENNLEYHKILQKCNLKSGKNIILVKKFEDMEVYHEELIILLIYMEITHNF